MILIRMSELSRLPRRWSKTQLPYYRNITVAIKYSGGSEFPLRNQWQAHLAAGAFQGDQEAPAFVAAGFCTNPLQ